MTIITPQWQRSMSIKIWTQGMKKTLMVITEPKKDRGTSSLKLDNQMWNYLPKIKKMIKIPPSMMMRQ